MESGEHSLIEYRLDELHTMVRDQMREGKEFRFEVRAFIERQKDAESDHRLAIDRCKKTGQDLEALQAVVANSKSRLDPVTLWTSIGAAATAIVAILAAIFHKGSP